MEGYKLISKLKEIPEFEMILKKITLWMSEQNENYLSELEKRYLLACAIILIKNYNIDRRYKTYTCWWK